MYIVPISMINHVLIEPEVSMMDAQLFCIVCLGVKLAKRSVGNCWPVDRLCVGDVVVQMYDALLWFKLLIYIDAVLLKSNDFTLLCQV